ncbi:MAG TPA: glycoside hydrolase family 15 protein [Acidobacteriaceae bacterium]|nr:glycoside hydrolase family 15 protein [Acidobacteriaceae bacterium]
MTDKRRNLPIESYAMIGDCETAALVSCDGSIDWLCWPDFSSSACFARLLGTEENGYWLLGPAGEVIRSSRCYREHTLILETTFETREGAVTLIDFMPIRGTNSDVVRIVKGVRGRVPIRMELALRFGYGDIVPWVRTGESGWSAIAGPDLAMLRTKAPLRGEDMRTVSEFTLHEGEVMEFALTYGASHRHAPRPIDVQQALAQTQSFWEEWAGRCRYEGPYRSAVERSLITLKALTYRPTGGIVAAVTTSLPEQIGGPRNWDYRYCWLRDATFTLLALMNGGYYQEAKEWQSWLLRAIAGSPDQVQIMYGIAGERRLPEWEVDWLQGYEGSKPVRVGNAAAGQLQLDIYGELLDAFFHALNRLGKERELDFNLLRGLIEHLETIWQKPDEGIWETRNGPRCFTYSKVMAWVAFDRAIRVSEALGADAPVARWREARAAVHDEICARAYNKKMGSFVQAYGSEELDAALLLIPLVGFLPPDDPRVEGTIEAIEQKLMPNGLVMRYNTATSNDGLPPGEGVFLACSCWMVSSLKLIGREKDATRLFEKVLGLANDVGLLAEEYDVRGKRLVGNFPQALSHIALANAAFDLAGGNGSSHSRAQRKPDSRAAHRKA